MSNLRLGTFGVWRGYKGFSPESVAEIEELGYGTVWLGGSPPAALEEAEQLLAATTTLTVATGIVNIWTADASEVAESFHRIDAKYPGRLLLGIGAGHREATAEYKKPYEALVDYLDELDAGGVPQQRRVLAALGPRVLRLAADRTAGAHPYLTTPAHTKEARAILDSGPILAPEHKVVLDEDAGRARATARPTVAVPYLQLSNYVANLKRLGFTDADIADGGSDAVIDALVAQGGPAKVARQLLEHLDAGADHVAIQVLPPTDDPLPTLRVLARELGLGSA